MILANTYLRDILEEEFYNYHNKLTTENSDLIAFQKYISTDEVNCETLSFVECGGSSLSAICLAEDILCVLNTDINNSLDLLVDVILHGHLQDVINYLCDNLASSKSATPVVTSGSNVTADHTGQVKTSLDGIRSMESSALSVELSAEEILPNSMLKKAVRHLSASDLGDTIKRSRLSSVISDDSLQSEKSEVIDSELCSRPSSGLSDLSVCHCLGPKSQQGDFIQLSRGSRRVTCCHVNCATVTESNLQSCCVVNVFKPTSYMELPLSSKGNRVDLKLAWKYDTGKCIDASPLIVCSRVGEAHVYIGSHSHRFVAVSLDTGVASWDITLRGRIESSAALSHCKQYLVVGCYDGKVYVISRTSGDVKWSYQTQSQVKCSACINPRNGLVYIGSHDKCLYALDIQKSACLWKLDLGRGSIFSSPCLSLCPYQLVVGTLGGQLIAVHPDSGNILWMCDIGKPLFSSPVPCQHGYIVGCVDHGIYCISFAGDQLWNHKTSGPVFSSACICNCAHETNTSDRELFVPNVSEVVLIGSHDNNLYCLRTLDGTVMWKVTLDAQVYSTPSLWRDDCEGHSTLKTGFVVACSQRGSVFIVKLLTGEIVAKFSCEGETFSSAVVLENRLVVGCRDNSIYSFTIEQ